MTNSLTNYTNKLDLAFERKPFIAFIDTLTKINPNISETDILMIRECIKDDKITIEELQRAVKQAYKDPQRYGKVEWNHVWKWVKYNRENPVFDGGTW